jgi:bacteriorhodopsin
MMVYKHPLETFILQNFMIEWSMTTPLLLLNITHVSKVKLFKQLVLFTCSVLMNVFGYLANGVQDMQVMLTLYSLGCVCLSIISIYFMDIL